MTAPVSIKDVAALAGVSTGTVSNVLNRPDRVAEAARDRVYAAISELGFVRNESARQLRVGRSRMIGLVVLDVANPFFTDVALGVEEEASEAGLSLLLCNSDDQVTRQVRHLEPGDLIAIGTPALNWSAGKQAGADLAEMPAGDRPTAVFCANDLLALGLLQELTRRGLRVPGDVAIVGYDDIEFAAAAAVPISSVRQPRRQLGRTAAQLLLEEAAATGSHAHRQVIFQPELVTRESSGQH